MQSTVYGYNKQTWIKVKNDDLPDTSVSLLLYESEKFKIKILMFPDGSRDLLSTLLPTHSAD